MTTIIIIHNRLMNIRFFISFKAMLSHVGTTIFKSLLQGIKMTNHVWLERKMNPNGRSNFFHVFPYSWK